MKKQRPSFYPLIFFLTLFSLPVFSATPPYFFLDGEGGWARINDTQTKLSREHNTGGAYNVNAGYAFRRFFAMEMGYYGLPNNTFHQGIRGTHNEAAALDIKVIIPYDNGFNIIGKAGVAASRYALTPSYVPTMGYIEDAGDYVKAVMLLGLGFSYSFTKHLDAVIQGTGLSHNGVIPAKIMVTTGLTYNF